MAEIFIVYDQKTGEFKGVRLDGKPLEEVPAHTVLDHLSESDLVQHENIELYHYHGISSICYVHVLCKAYNICYKPPPKN